MVAGTTRRAGQASIITTRLTPASAARNSVWPGKAKPAPSFSAFLLIGAVQMAEASPAMTSRDGALDDRDHPGRIAGSGWPGTAAAGKRCDRTGSTSSGDASQRIGRSRDTLATREPCGRWRGSPIQKNGRRPPSAGTRLHRDLRSDARRIAAGEGDGHAVLAHGSRITAAARSFLR